MASFAKSPVLVAFCLAIRATMLSSVFAAHAIDDVVPLPPLPPKTHDFLEQCAMKIAPICGEEIKASIYKDGRPSDLCCQDLVIVGQDCHNEFAKIVFSHLPVEERPKALARSNKVWDDCVKLVGGVAPSA